MRLMIYNFVIFTCTVFDYPHFFAFAKPMVGENVRQAKDREFPSTVSIKYRNSLNIYVETDHDCTGVLTSKRDVLTAAHCFDNYKLTNIEILVGSNDLRHGDKHYPLWWITYDQWAKERKMNCQYPQNDIGIIRLIESVSAQITPVILSTIPVTDLYGTNVAVAGWGKMRNGEIPRFMETVDLLVLSKTECENRIEELHGSKVVMDERYLCTAANPYAILHEGDSGGPLLRMGTLIGINKSTCPFPDIDIHPKKVNVHFSINFYKNFVYDVMTNYT